MSYTPSVTATERYATVDVVGQRFAYPVSTATIADVVASVKGNNLIKESNNPAGPSWTKTRATISATTLDVTLDSGEVVTMSKIVEDGTVTNNHQIIQTTTNRADLPIVVSFLLKQSDAARNGAQVEFYGDSFASSIYATFNAEAGSVVSSGVTGAGVVSSTSITAVGNGAYRCVLVGVASVTAGNIGNQVVIRITNNSNSTVYSGDSTSGVYIGQMQLVEGTEATTYQETSSQALTSGDDMSTSDWNTSQLLSRTAGQADYQGGTKATRVIPNTSNAQHIIWQTVTAADYVDNSIVTASVVAKANGYSHIYLVVNTKSNAYRGSHFNLSDGTLGTNSSATSRSITSVGDGWYRCTITVDINSGGTTPRPLVYVEPSDNNLSYEGNGTSGVLLSHPLFHAGTVQQEYANERRPRIAGDGQRLTHSGDLANAAWTKTRTTISGTTHDATLDTGEVLTMQKLVQDGTAANTHEVLQNSDVSALVQSIFKVKVKLADAGFPHARVAIYNGSVGADLIRTNINLSTGVLSSTTTGGTGSGASASVVSLGDGVYEVALTGIPSTSAGMAQAKVLLLSADGSTDVFNGDSASGCYVDEPILVAGSTAPSYTRSYADRLAAGGSTRDRAYVLIPHIDEFDAAGDHIGTRWNTEQTWAVTDGTTTATSTESFAPPEAANFDSVGVGPYQYPPDGVTPGDDGYVHVLTGSGVVTADSFTFSPAEESSIRTMAYDVVGAEWLPYREETGLGAFVSALSGVIRSVIKSVIRTVVY